jgi:hypothetical protein
MKLDYLFSRRDSGESRSRRQEPSLGRTALAGGLPALPEPEEEGFEPISVPYAGRNRSGFLIDPHRMSPRQLADWAHDMYLCRNLAWEEYCMVGFPAELHPQYNKTVGALTGGVAQPDAPRDMIRAWEERRAFLRRYYQADAPEVLRVEKLLVLLKAQVPRRVGR